MFFSSVEWMSSAFGRKAEGASMRATVGMGSGWSVGSLLVSLKLWFVCSGTDRHGILLF